MGQASSSPSRRDADDSISGSTSSPCAPCRWKKGCVRPPFVGIGQKRNRDIWCEIEPSSPSCRSTTGTESTVFDHSGSIERNVQSNEQVPERTTSKQYTLQTLPFAPTPPDELLGQIVAVDCGMVRVGPRLPRSKKKKKKKSQRHLQPATLRRVCIVDGRGVPLLNETVRVPPASSAVETHPQGYQTTLARQLSDHVLPRINPSGDDLNVGLCPDEVKKAAADLVKGKIVIGHSVNCDLGVLDLLQSHPRAMVRDTALYPPFLNKRGQSQRLSFLVKTRLGRNIQKEARYHGCMEDAVASLDLYLSDWEKWEKMSACSPLIHTHTSKCDLTNVSSLRVEPAGAVSRDLAILPQSKKVSPAGEDGKKTIVAKSINSRNSRRPSKKELRRQKCIERKRRKRERRASRVAIQNNKKPRSHVATVLFFPVDVLSFILGLPVRVLSYSSAAASDVARLVVQGPTLAWRYIIVKLGYQAVPGSFQNQCDRGRGKQKRLSRQRARSRKQLIYRLLLSFRDYILLSHAVFELLAIAARYQRQELGIIMFNGLGDYMCNHWGITMIAASMSLMSVPVRNRCSQQSRICICILAYYHILFLYNAYERGEWEPRCLARWRGGRPSPGISAPSYAYIYDWYLIYHFVFFLYSPAGMLCTQLVATHK